MHVDVHRWAIEMLSRAAISRFGRPSVGGRRTLPLARAQAADPALGAQRDSVFLAPDDPDCSAAIRLMS